MKLRALASDAATSLQPWAQQVSSGCSKPKGVLNLYHSKDGTILEGTANSPKPAACSFPDRDTKVDCFGWNALADGVEEKFCGNVAGVTQCSQRATYCEGKSGACDPIQ